ncbi:MAG: U32 family peptidase [Deltaproteobacteria bacterium]|nr:U32 family peptidase [Deltaproteobacteria bacterium]
METETKKPEILAPAGDREAFLAAIAAGADAIYCGVKNFSARMAARNFTISELAGLTAFAHDRGVSVYVALNTIVKPAELDAAGMVLDRINKYVCADALIIQDLAFISLARQVGFSGEIHLSTLANVSFSAAIRMAGFFKPVTRVVLPRELSIDEIKSCAAAASANVSLEVFIHGALCYGISGRCYWSSYMGGKSGLRGRCVQPCRRIYTQEKSSGRFFSCRDLALDVLIKLVSTVPGLSALKIEGRKKSAHYVYYTTSAYRLLIDNPGDSDAKKTAMQYLDYALGRPRTHYNFLPQRPWNPIDINSQTGSGLLVGKVSGTSEKPCLTPREALFPDDRLRIGYEDSPGHHTFILHRRVPKRGKLYLKLNRNRRPSNHTPVFLIDRRDPGILDQIKALDGQALSGGASEIIDDAFTAVLPRAMRKGGARRDVIDMTVRRVVERPKSACGHEALWVTPDTKPIGGFDKKRFWWWLPPVIWPDDELKMTRSVNELLKKGYTNFVINAFTQAVFFPADRPELNVWAGPFCNVTNVLAIKNLARMGLSGVIVSPELGAEDYAQLPEKSSLPLGMVISGNWPLSVSRTVSGSIKPGILFKSPKGEGGWVSRNGSDYWIFPDWKLDLTPVRGALEKMGYRLFVTIIEPLPRGISMKKRPGMWNWKLGVK